MAKEIRRPRGRATFLGKAERERIAAMASGGSPLVTSPSDAMIEKALVRDGVSPQDFVNASPDKVEVEGQFYEDIVTKS